MHFSYKLCKLIADASNSRLPVEIIVTDKETNGWKWPIFMITYMTVLAYGMSFIVFQVGQYLGFV